METKGINTNNTCCKSGEEDNDLIGINISERVKTFLWIWNKTGTSHMKKVLKFFGFKFYYLKDGEIKLEQNDIVQLHNCQFFPGHENYHFMVSARNPYTRFVSHFRFNSKNLGMDLKKLDEKQFQEFLEEKIFQENIFQCTTFHKRLPDYYVRVENMFEDYSKIPFITDSDLFKSGILKEMCEKKVNENPLDRDWRDFYTPQIADLIYYNTQEYFKFFGYDKNSWKK